MALNTLFPNATLVHRLQLLTQQIEIAFEYPFRHCLLQILIDESEERSPASGGGRTVTLK